MTMGDRSINEYYEKMKTTVDLLENIGSSVPQQAFVLHFLNGLSPKFNHIAIFICHKEPIPSLLQAQSNLLLKESRMSQPRLTNPSYSDHASALLCFILGLNILLIIAETTIVITKIGIFPIAKITVHT